MPIAIRRGGMAPLWRRAQWLVALGAIQVAGPFLLISAGEQHIASSLAGILVAAAPIFTAILAIWIDKSERLSTPGVVGVAVGIVGVALLLGVDLGGPTAALLGRLMVALASVGQAIRGIGL